MGIVQDTREMVAKGRVTVIDGQITQEDFTKLVQELCQIGSSIPTSIGGGTLGHVGLILNQEDYVLRSAGGVIFSDGFGSVFNGDGGCINSSGTFNGLTTGGG